MDQHKKTITELEPGPARFEYILDRLGEGFALCRSLGLRPEQGRFSQYRDVVERLLDIATSDPENFTHRTQDARYRVAVTESLELADMLPYLVSCSPGTLKPKLRLVLDGPEMPSDETPASNEARNIQLELRLASLLSQAGFSPNLGEKPDLWLDRPWTFLFECKRVFSYRRIRDRIWEAGQTLREARKNHVASAEGIIAISLSRLLIDDDDRAIPIPNSIAGKASLGAWVERVQGAFDDIVRRVFEKSLTIAVFFYVASDFANRTTSGVDRGFSIYVHADRPPFAPYGRALDELKQGFHALEKLYSPRA